MQLPPGERSILAYFPTSTAARQAADALRGAGFGQPRIDRASRHGISFDTAYNNPINNATTITGPTLYSDDSGALSDDVRVLLAADPSVSGYGNTDYGVAGGAAFLLTLVTTEDKVDQAVDIIKKYGGQV